MSLCTCMAAMGIFLCETVCSVGAWTDVPGAPRRPGHLSLMCLPPPEAQHGRARLWAAGKGEWTFPGHACPRALLLAQEHSHFPIPGKEHNVHWLFSRLPSPTPLLPQAARHFLTRTRRIQRVQPWRQSGRKMHGLQECQRQARLPSRN